MFRHEPGSLPRKWLLRAFITTLLSVFAALTAVSLLNTVWPEASVQSLAGQLLKAGVIVLTVSVIVVVAVWLQSRFILAISDNLHRITRGLPLLGAKRFAQARDALIRGKSWPLVTEFAHFQDNFNQLVEQLTTQDKLALDRIQHQHQLADQTRDQLSQIRGLIDAADMIIITVDQNLEIQFMNRFAEEFTGVSVDGIMDTSVAQVFPSSHWSETAYFYQEIFNGHRETAHHECELIDTHGEIRNIFWLHSHLDTPDGRLILSIGHDNTYSKTAENRLVWLAHHDPLTRLLNHSHFMESFQLTLQDSLRYKRQYALVYLSVDLTRYHKLDKSLSWQRCDEMLVQIAETLKSATRFTDIIARTGEYDFALIQPESSENGRDLLIKKLIDEVEKLGLVTPNKKLPIRIHAGVVHYPFEHASAQELMGFADLALARARTAYPDQHGYEVFSTDDIDADQLNQRVFWKQRILRAIEARNFVLQFQPIRHIKTERIVWYEVLVRLRDEETGELLSAANFIEIADKQGLAEHIDRFVLQACFDHLDAHSEEDAGLSINLSRLTMNPHTILPLLKKLLKRYDDVDASRLLFEINEKTLTDDPDQSRLTMTALKKLGARFAIDDFGIDGTVSKYGLSAFTQLRQMPVDMIKIHGSFIKTMTSNNEDQLFVKMLVDEAKSRGIETAAEFVEDSQTLERLKLIGVDYAQGYFIGHPADWPAA